MAEADKNAKTIDNMMRETRQFPPSAEFSKNSYYSSLDQYQTEYSRSINDPDAYWAEQARKHLVWSKDFSKVSYWDPSAIGAKEAPYVQWFSDGELNVSYNCLDRHIAAGKGDRTALIWQGEDSAQKRKLTFLELFNQVEWFAGVLKGLGAKRGTTVTIFMPMIPETAVAMLACTRIGAIHSVVFSAFSPDSLRSRINDCASSIVITSDVSYHGGKTLELKKKVDEALNDTPTIEHVIVYNRGNSSPPMTPGRDIWWHEANSTGPAPAEPQPAETPLFILYTSGSTGKPKGVLHTTGGYLLYAHMTFKYVFDYHEHDLFWCTADVGWITGHSYVVYGPLSNGATVMMFEGIPTYPAADRFWEIIAEYKVTIFYTAPTAIRALMRLGEELPAKHDLSSLRLLGTVGEPINPEAWVWYYENIGKRRCPIVDTWWQTETGGIMITTLPGAMAARPASAGKPFFGVAPQVLRSDGSTASVNEGGSLVLTKPWPGMLRGVYGDKIHDTIKKVYFTAFGSNYFTGDGCRTDPDGYQWLMGRIDDVLNVSAHRISTAELESTLVGFPGVAEAAVVGFPHDIKGQGIYCFVTLKQDKTPTDELRKALIAHVRKEISPIATPDKIQFTPALPKTRSGKIMRRILRKIAEGDLANIGDTSTLADPSVVDALLHGSKHI